MNELDEDFRLPTIFNPAVRPFDQIAIASFAGAHSVLVFRRDQKAGNHQLPDLQTGA